MQNITGRSEPFGGKVVVGLGDFRQVAPVVPNGGPSAIFDASVRSSDLWELFEILSLTEPIRNAMDPEFSAWVDEIGEGLEGPEVLLPNSFITKVFGTEDAIRFLFPTSLLHDYQSIAKRSFLSPLNFHVDAFNAQMLKLIDGDVRSYYSFDSIKEDERSTGSTVPPEMTDYLSMAAEPGIPSYELRLKENCLCSLMRNISVDSGLVKNARVIVQRLLDHVVEVETLPTSLNAYQSAKFLLPRILFEFQPKFCPWTIQRLQFPLRLAYATTFNSCQGLTLDRAVIDMRVPVFAHGQLYTALSRVRSRELLRCLFDPPNPDGSAQDDHLRVTNVVFKDLLL
jgi:hypothetical protein